MGIEQLLKESIRLLQKHEPPDGYWGAFSGGKDSIVIKHLARVAGVRVDWHYNVTCIDPPQVISFMREHHRDVRWERSRHGNFFKHMEKKGLPPTRHVRWCCEKYKEHSNPSGRVLLMGIRAEESPKRASLWQPVTYMTRTKSDAVLPILSWPSEELWEYIRGENIPYCSLYDEGFTRLGCIGCPLPGPPIQRKEFDRWPGFERRWRLAFKRMWEIHAGRIVRGGTEWFGSVYFDGWEQMWEWWMSNGPLPSRKKDKQLDLIEGSRA